MSGDVGVGGACGTSSSVVRSTSSIDNLAGGGGGKFFRGRPGRRLARPASDVAVPEDPVATAAAAGRDLVAGLATLSVFFLFSPLRAGG